VSHKKLMVPANNQLNPKLPTRGPLYPAKHTNERARFVLLEWNVDQPEEEACNTSTPATGSSTWRGA
jgi:hypothetical protein